MSKSKKRKFMRNGREYGVAPGAQPLLLSLTSDLIFKAAFGRDTPLCKKALIGILNLILERWNDPIVDLIYKNPFSIADHIDGKTMVMDIKVQTQSGELIDIEMQVENLQFFPGRTVVYHAKMMGEQLAEGETYDKIKKTIVVSIVSGRLFPNTEKFATTFRYKEIEEDFELTNLSELHFLELDKIDLTKGPEEMTPLELLGAYLRCAGDAEQTEYVERILKQKDEVIAMSDQILKSISQDDQLRELQLARELGELFNRMEKGAVREKALAEGMEIGLVTGRAEGIAEGEARGEARGQAKGEAKAILELAKKMKQMGKSMEEICQLTGLSQSTVETL